jgi:hypothetical protein
MADLTGADLEAVAEDVRVALRLALKPAARARLDAPGAFARELDTLTDAAAALVWALDRRDGSAGWACAITIRARAYAIAMLEAEAAASAVTAVERAARPSLFESTAEKEYLKVQYAAWREGKMKWPTR